MIITYLRSSSIGTLKWCEHKYFIEYNLGHKDATNKKAWMGTVVHRVMQVLGDKKIALNEGKRKVRNDDIQDLWLKECDDIDAVTKLCFDYYMKNDPVDADEKDLKTCIKWVNKALEFNGGYCDPRNQNVHATEVFFDIEIDKPWARYDYKVGDLALAGNLSIKGTVDLVLREGDAYFQVLDYKGLPVNTPIPTPHGWSTMGDLKVGDVVFDQYGQQTKVTAKSTQKFKECYEIIFDDTSKAVCDDEHYWKLADGSVVQIGDLKIGDCINVAEPLRYDKKSLPIDPYVLGIWLGDGRSRRGEIKSRGFKVGENLEKREVNCESRTVYGLTTELRKLGLLDNKHIPNLYLQAGYEQRLALLQGLMDSDGSVNTTRKQCVFMNCNKQLSSDVKELLLSLGQRPLLSDVHAEGFGVTTRAYPVSFRAIGINPFRLPLKKSKLDIAWGPGNSDKRRIVSIEKIETKLTQCISVDSEDHTYLCTENMIPTHNTGKRLNWATGKTKEYEDFESDPQLLLYYYALRNLYPNSEFFVTIYYINDGGIYSTVFDDSHYQQAEEMLKNHFEYIRGVEIPRQLSPDNSHWKCQRLCKFAQPSPMDPGRTICQFYHDEVQNFGVEKTILSHGNPEKIDAYGSGGGRIG